MLSKIPIDLSKIKPEDIDKEILRTAIIAEQDAVSLYEQMAGSTKDKNLKNLLLDVAKEEKTHIGEFNEYLKTIDAEYSQELENGKKEVERLRRVVKTLI